MLIDFGNFLMFEVHANYLAFLWQEVRYFHLVLEVFTPNIKEYNKNIHTTFNSIRRKAWIHSFIPNLQTEVL